MWVFAASSLTKDYLLQEMPREPVINDKIRQAIEDKKKKVRAKTSSPADLVLRLDRYHVFLKEDVSLEATEGNEKALQGSLQLLDLQGDVSYQQMPVL